MGKIFCVMGKSATGKDTIYKKLLQREELNLERVIPYTTRPIRDGEIPGKDYHFISLEDVDGLEAEGRVIEQRSYNTVYGLWKYLTVDDGNIKLDEKDYLVIGTVEAYVSFKEYYGEEHTVPIYIEVEDGDRLLRAISREKQQEIPKYEEMCRRFLADAKDFSEENLAAAGIKRRFMNVRLSETIAEIANYIKEMR